MKIATEKVWVKQDGSTLVRDEDPEAAVLVAAKGQVVHPRTLTAYSNAEEFFTDANAPESTQLQPRSRTLLPEPDPKEEASIPGAEPVTRDPIPPVTRRK